MNMDWNLEPPGLSAKEEWVEKKVDEWLENMGLFIDEVGGVDLFDYLDVDKLTKDLTERADELYEEMVGEAQIEAWEARQESRWGDYIW